MDTFRNELNALFLNYLGTHQGNTFLDEVENLHERYCEMSKNELIEDKELMLESIDLITQNLKVIHTQAENLYKLHSDI